MSESILKRFITGTLFTGTGRLFIVVIGLIGFMLTARWLTTEELGMFTLLQVSVSFVISFSDFGIGTAITKFTASNDDPDTKNKLISTAFYARMITLVAAAIIALIARRLLFNLFGSSLYVDLLIFIPILVSIEGIMLLIGSIYEGLFEFRVVGIADALSSISNFAGILILVVWQEQGLMGRIYAKIFSVIVTLFFLIIVNRFRPKLIFAWNSLKDMLKFGLPLYINQILTFVFLRADTIIIGTFLGASDIALYEIARKIPESLEMLYDAFRKVYFPFVSKLYADDQHEKCSQLLNTSTRLVAFLGGLGALGVFLFGEEIIVLLFSAKYLPSVPIFSILMVGLILMVLDYTLGYTLVAIGESDKPPIINTVHTAVNFIGYFILIPVFGVAGAALSGVIGTATVNPFNLYLIRRKEIGASLMAYMKPLMILAACVIILIFFQPHNLMLRAAILILYLVLSIIFSVVKKEDWQIALREIRSFINSRKKPQEPSTWEPITRPIALRQVALGFDKPHHAHLVWISDMPLENLLHGATWLSTTHELRTLGWRVTLVTPGFSGIKEIRGVKAFGIERPEVFIRRHIVYQFRILLLLISLRGKVDVVLFNELPAISFFVLRTLRKLFRRRRPLYIMDTRSLLMPPEEKKELKDHLRGYYMNAVNWLANYLLDGRTAITGRMAESLHITKKKLIGIWPSGVDLKPFNNIPEWYWTGELVKTIRLIYIGSMHYERNLMALSQAVYRASQLGMSFELVLIGDGEEFDDLKIYSVVTNNVIRVYPSIPHKEVPGWLQKSHIGVLPFPDEEKFRVSSPIKLFEYMAAGLPILATRIACHTDVVGDGRYVFWAEGSSCEDLLETLKTLWSNRESLQDMGGMAAIAAQNWTWKASAMKLHMALTNALENFG